MPEKMRVEDRVTQAIIDQLAAGVRPWSCPWSMGGAAIPLRVNGEPYRGINVLLLWIQAANKGYVQPHWMTYQQAKALGGQVRKGETSTLVVYYGEASRPDDADDEQPARRFLKSYNVFNVQQIDGLPEAFTAITEAAPTAEVDWDARVEGALAATGADISWTGAAAYYAPGPDHIRMPDRSRFRDAEQAYSTLCHELIHWTGAKHRLDRLEDAPFGSPAYAREELVAELGSAFLGVRLGFRPDHIEDHAAYIGGWIKKLRADSRAVLKAASAAQAAADYIMARIEFTEAAVPIAA